mgnify:CR=1 FL=1
MSGIDRLHHFFDAAVAPGVTERPLLFECKGEQLLGVLAQPERSCDCGVLIIVGGPQYRAGSHRQFVTLARHLAAAGYASLRFDYRGMGDSGGDARDFRETAADIAAALRAFAAAAPHVRRFVLFGLCDAASAALMHGAALPQVAGMALLNPWVRSETTLARAQVKHYYRARLADPAFWRKLCAGEVKLGDTAAAFARRLGVALRPAVRPRGDFREKMADGMLRFRRPVLVVLSGRDLTAQEFREHVASDRAWQKALLRAEVTRIDIEEADHTFSRAAWRERLHRVLLDWLDGHCRGREAA